MPQEGRLQQPGTLLAGLPLGARTPEHMVDRAWESKSSEVRSGSLSRLWEQRVSFGPGHRPLAALWFRGCWLPGQEGVILSITDFLPTLHTLVI